LLRIVVGLLFACHGAQKLFGLFGGVGEQPGAAVTWLSLIGLAGFIELVGGLLIALGVLVSYTAFIASGEMAFAYFMGHAPRGFWPIENGDELPRALLLHVPLYCGERGWQMEPRRLASALEPAPHGGR